MNEIIEMIAGTDFDFKIAGRLKGIFKDIRDFDKIIRLADREGQDAVTRGGSSDDGGVRITVTVTVRAAELDNAQ